MREDLVEVMRSEMKELRHALAKEREHKRDRGVCKTIEKERKEEERKQEKDSEGEKKINK